MLSQGAISFFTCNSKLLKQVFIGVEMIAIIGTLRISKLINLKELDNEFKKCFSLNSNQFSLNSLTFVSQFECTA